MKRLIYSLSVVLLLSGAAFCGVSELAAEATRFSNEGKYAEAADKFNEAIKLAPENSSLHLSLGLVYRSMARYDDAIRAIEKAIALGEGTGKPHAMLGLCYEAKAVSADPALAKAYWNKALEAWNRAVMLAPDAERRAMAQKHIDKIKGIIK